MQSIPTVNLAAVVHLYFISVFIGMYASEAVLEVYSFFHKDDEQTHSFVIRMHYWIDNFVEIPTVIAIIIS